MKNKILLFVITSALILTSCSTNNSNSSMGSFSSTSSDSSNEKTKCEKIYDIDLGDKRNLNTDIEIAEFPETKFRLNSGNITADGNLIVNSCNSIYLYDVNGDGYRDFCYCFSSGSGSINDIVEVFDYKNKTALFKISERFRFDYRLKQEENTLYVVQYSFYDTGSKNRKIFGMGELKYSDIGDSYIQWKPMFGITNFDLKVSLANEEETPINITSLPSVSIDLNKQYFLDLNVESSESLEEYQEYGKPYLFSFLDNYVLPYLKITQVNASNKKFRYRIYPTALCNINLDIRAGSITKQLKISVRDDTKGSPKINKLFSWASNITENNLTRIKYKYDKYDESGSDGHGSFYAFNNPVPQQIITNAIQFLNQTMFESSNPNIDRYTSSYEYLFTIDGVEQSLQVVAADGYYIKTDTTYYSFKDLMDFYSGNSVEQVNGCFLSHLPDYVSIKRVSDNQEVDRIRNLKDYEFYLDSDFKVADDYIKNAKYYLDLKTKVYIIDENTTTMIGEKYLYHTSSENNFSFLF